MANPNLDIGFDTNDTNTTPLTPSKITDGFAIEETVSSAVHNEMFKQLFAAANKAKIDGAWDWETGLTYRKGALVWYNDTLWKSIASANQGNTPITGAFWKEPGIEDAVSLVGDQTVDGIKTFLESPIAPTPTLGDDSTKVATTAFVTANASGLDIASTAEAQAGTDNTKAITPLRLREGLNASGTAPIYACRAWVNFNGTGTVAIRGSGNVSSITDNGTGDYTVNFITAMPDANYEPTVLSSASSTESSGGSLNGVRDIGISSYRITNGNVSGSLFDPLYICSSVRR